MLALHYLYETVIVEIKINLTFFSAPKHSRSLGSKAVVQGKPPSLPRIPYQAEEPSAGNNEEMSACFVINIK